MGFHHVYDNAKISECIAMIEEIQAHLNYLIQEARWRIARNKMRNARRKAGIEDVSDNESIDSGYDTNENNVSLQLNKNVGIMRVQVDQ